MNMTALRAVPRRAWWTLAVVILIVSAFAFDRDLGVTVVAVALALRLLADRLKPSEAPWRVADSSRERRWARLPTAVSGFGCASFLNDDDFPLKAGGDGDRINPATGSFMSEYSGLDGGGHRYGESNNNGMDHRW